MIFSIIVIAIVGIVAFFHYLQGFFSATLSAVITIIAAVLAVSYHEPVVEAVMGAKAAGVSHALTLSLMFAVTYLILRVMFDKMVPGNVRVPAILDKVGGGAMGLVAGVFVAGIVALIAQYLPMMPAVGGYSRYTVDEHDVTLPSIEGRRQQASKVWDELKSQKPGQFDPVDKTGLMIPADDLLVKTVNHLSDGGSLSGKQPLAKVHPDLLGELFAQRLGIQTGATRVVSKQGVAEVALFHTGSLKFIDHDYKEIRKLDLKGFPTGGGTEIKPNAKQLLLIVRVTFTRYASDGDHWVRFSPGSARLVTRAANGAEGEMMDNYPIGTVDAAKTLYLSKPDDFLLAKDDTGVDFAYLIDKASLVGGGAQSASMKVADGVFFEFKRLARYDLGTKPISGNYKASPTVKVERKLATAGQVAAAAAEAEKPGAGNIEELKERLAGNWMGTSDAGQLLIDFNADGSLKINNTPKTGLPTISQGTWAAVRADGPNILVITRTIGGSTAEATVTFDGNDKASLGSANAKTPIPLTRRS